ncbi:hypothetical protein GCM10010238_18330 [Streptomyces griseoviridis]|uniref:Uncharacterized protein n=1 Tax=Streptomyces griseoviridis TaxID=45398 RepID=A0A918GCE0_STRGD|nr:hypothetical protein GCM10010238_18330 [Streptomyces niveoruber]
MRPLDRDRQGVGDEGGSPFSKGLQGYGVYRPKPFVPLIEVSSIGVAEFRAQVGVLRVREGGHADSPWTGAAGGAGPATRRLDG